jgi:predicted transposase/invertase (TIGR01784 family)
MFRFNRASQAQANKYQRKKLAVLWLRFLKEINEKTDCVDVTLLEIASYNEAELLLYDQYWDLVSSEKTMMLGKLNKGIEIGEAKGIVKGKEEEKKTFIMSMYRSGFSIEQVAKVAELSEEQVQRMINRTEKS